ncbi:MAG: hypothetical protein QOE46_2881 [Acidobacteriota bacterium]|jgi:hypothetical protein|nr:hypothetical protein [Acidobacteriota bacterium]
MQQTQAARRNKVTFAPELTLGEARSRLFALGNLGVNGGYDEAWVKLKLGRIPLAFPNTEGRRRAVRFHDLHHVLTEYPTTWRGEFEIGAWEVATGVGPYWEGWLLDLLGFGCGLIVFPRSVYRAFLRGRRSANLYGDVWNESILSRRVGEVRRRLHLDEDGAARPTQSDKRAFAAWAAISLLTYAASCAAVLIPLLALLAFLWLWLAR